MNDIATSSSVVVGIDGSKAAVRATLWAVDEAVSRDTSLCLVHVIDADDHSDRALADGYDILHKAWTAVEATGKPVKLESDIMFVDPGEVLVDSSRHAEIVCVGSKGADDRPQECGATAAQVAQSAFSPVAIVHRRHTHRPMPAGRWIFAALDESPHSHSVLQTAMEEARLRNAPVLALTPWSTTGRQLRSEDIGSVRAKLERFLDESEYEDADVSVHALPTPTGMHNTLKLLAQTANIVQLVIVGQHNHDLVEHLVGNGAAKFLKGTNCSLLIDRERNNPS
jgi:nucleotide-binding universal stress UspA family protein